MGIFPSKLHLLNSSITTRESLTSKVNNGNFKSQTNYAIIEIGGVQKIVEEGRYYTCNRLQVEVGSKLRFGRVLAVKNEGDLCIGTPWVERALVEAQVIEEFADKKIIVYKMKSKKHSRNKNGHRQLLTRFIVNQIRMI